MQQPDIGKGGPHPGEEAGERFIDEEFSDTGSGHKMRAYRSFDRPLKFSLCLGAHLVKRLELVGGDIGNAVWDI